MRHEEELMRRRVVAKKRFEEGEGLSRFEPRKGREGNERPGRSFFGRVQSIELSLSISRSSVSELSRKLSIRIVVKDHQGKSKEGKGEQRMGEQRKRRGNRNDKCEERETPKSEERNARVRLKVRKTR